MVKAITQREWQAEVLNSPIPVLVDFWAVWCGPCRLIAPIVEELARQYEGKLKVYKVDVDQEQSLAMQYGIMSIPTLLLFKNGQVVEQIVGALPKSAIEQRIAKHLGSLCTPTHSSLSLVIVALHRTERGRCRAILSRLPPAQLRHAPPTRSGALC